MEYGIQRRGIYLIPAEGDDAGWFFSQFEDDEVWQMFGMRGPSRAGIMRSFRLGEIVVGILYRVSDRKRTGFVVMFPPTEHFEFWEFGYGIPDPKDRDGFGALNATDAMAHYMFDHLGVESMGWRTRGDNKRADAVVRRLGYQSFGSWEVDGHPYTFYRLTKDGWKKRKSKLKKGEKARPSGIGDVFVTLDGPPYIPIDPEH